MAKILIKQACVVTMNATNDVFNGDVLIENRRIVKVGQSLQEKADKVIYANGKVLLPGFVQTHIHLCQTLRGLWFLVRKNCLLE